MAYYDWHRTLSFDAMFNIVLTARGRGKTYGLRKQCIKDFIKSGAKFVELCRFKTELKLVVSGYFDRVGGNPDFENYMFKTEGPAGFIAEKVEEGEKPKWRQICYFCALSDQQQLKKRTFESVKRVIFDEAILERRDRFHSYLPREYDVLVNMIDTIARQIPGQETSVRVYLLGNACDLINPYFQAFGIDKEPSFGFHWYKKKLCLLHYEDPAEYAEQKITQTLVGRLVEGTAEADVIASNRFADGSENFISRKSKNAKFEYGITYQSKSYGIWYDYNAGMVYVTSTVPADAKVIFALTTEDNRINYLMASRTTPVLRRLADLYRAGIVRFQTPAVREQFNNILRLLGVS